MNDEINQKYQTKYLTEQARVALLTNNNKIADDIFILLCTCTVKEWKKNRDRDRYEQIGSNHIARHNISAVGDLYTGYLISSELRIAAASSPHMISRNSILSDMACSKKSALKGHISLCTTRKKERG